MEERHGSEHHHHHHHRHKSRSPQPPTGGTTVDNRWAHQTVFSAFTTPPIEDKVINHQLAFPAVHPKYDPNIKHIAPEWHGPKDIHVTSTTVCGSDLHLYHNEFKPYMHVGDVVGHESKPTKLLYITI